MTGSLIALLGIIALVIGTRLCCAGVELDNNLPEHEYRDLFKPDDRLHISVSYEHENLNTQEYLDSLQQKLFNNLSRYGNLLHCR